MIVGFIAEKIHISTDFSNNCIGYSGIDTLFYKSSNKLELYFLQMWGKVR